MLEVKVDVLADVQPIDLPGKELAVGRRAQVVVGAREVVRRALLTAEVEGYALGIHVGYLLLDGQKRLGMPCGVG